MFPIIWSLENMPSWHWEIVEYLKKKKSPKTQHVFWCTARLRVYLPENKTSCNPAKTINLQLQILVTTHCDE